MLRLVVLSLVLVLPTISHPYWPQYQPNQVPYNWGPLCGGNAPCPYGYCPPPNIVHSCNHTEWICPKAPKIRRDHVPVPPSPGVYVTFCEYDEHCLDVDNKPHKCCFDSGTNARICKTAIKRKL